MLVFVAGMQRSGSTFSFNIARDILSARGGVYQEACGDALAVLSRAGNAKHVLLKAHFADPTTIALARYGAVRTIITVRRIQDAAASWIETFGFSEAQTIEQLGAWLTLYAQLRDQALIVPYRELDRRPWRTAWRIGRFLAADVTALEALKIARRHRKAAVKRRSDALDLDQQSVQDIGFSYYDHATFFHRRHVSTLRSRPAEVRLPLDQLARIQKALAPNIAAAGFEL